jgi:hypothetical protein
MTRGSRVLVSCDVNLVQPPIRFSIGVLLDLVGLAYEFETYSSAVMPSDRGMPILTYGPNCPAVEGPPHLHLQAADFFLPDRYLKRDSLPGEIVPFGPVAALYRGVPAASEPRSAVAAGGVDLVASTFVLLTCYEEVVAAGPLDTRGRRRAEDSFALRLRLIDRAVVNEYAEQLRRDFRSTAPDLRFADHTFRGSAFALALTHDVDSLRARRAFSSRALVKTVLDGKAKEGVGLVRQALRRRQRRDPYDNLDRLCEWEESVGVRSSVYLMASDLIGDADYRVRDVIADPAMTKLRGGQWELGFHPGHRTYVDQTAFKSELDELERALGYRPRGGRQHGLRFAAPYTWRYWEDAGLEYDSTIGFAEHPGFKAGICMPYRPFDILENRQLDIWELPLTLMDCTLDRYRGLSPALAAERVDALLATARHHCGVFVLLWHNSYFGAENSPYHGVLSDLVLKARDTGGLVGPASEILDSWRTALVKRRA